MQAPQLSAFNGNAAGAAALDRRSFALLSAETIRLWCEADGVSIAGRDVLLGLAQEVTYRTRHLVTKAAQRMRHSTRRRLTVEDVDAACEISKAPRLVGHLTVAEDLLPTAAPARLSPAACAAAAAIGGGDAADLAGLRYLPESPVDLLNLLRGAHVIEVASSPLSAMSVLQVAVRPSPAVNDAADAPLTPAETTYLAELRRLVLLRRPATFRHLIRHLATTDNPVLGRVFGRFAEFLGRLCRRFSHSAALLARCIRCLEVCAVNRRLVWSEADAVAVVDTLAGLLAATPACALWRPAGAADIQEAAASLLARVRRRTAAAAPADALVRRLLAGDCQPAAASALQAATDMQPLRRLWPAVSASLPRLLTFLADADVRDCSAVDAEMVATSTRLRCHLCAYLRRLAIESAATNSDWGLAAEVWNLLDGCAAAAPGLALLDLPLYRLRRSCAAPASVEPPAGHARVTDVSSIDGINSSGGLSVDGLMLMLLDRPPLPPQPPPSNSHGGGCTIVDVSRAPSSAGSPGSRPPVLEPAMPQLGLLQDDPVPSQLPLLGDDDDLVGVDFVPQVGADDVGGLFESLDFSLLPMDQCSETSTATVPAICDRPLTPLILEPLPPPVTALETPSQHPQPQQSTLIQLPVAPIFELISPPLPQPMPLNLPSQISHSHSQLDTLLNEHRLLCPAGQPVFEEVNEPDPPLCRQPQRWGQRQQRQPRWQPPQESEFYRLFQRLKWRFGWGIGRAAPAAAVSARFAAAASAPSSSSESGAAHGGSDLVRVLPEFAYPL